MKYHNIRTRWCGINGKVSLKSYFVLSKCYKFSSQRHSDREWKENMKWENMNNMEIFPLLSVFFPLIQSSENKFKSISSWYESFMLFEIGWLAVACMRCAHHSLFAYLINDCEQHFHLYKCRARARSNTPYIQNIGRHIYDHIFWDSVVCYAAAMKG